MDGYLLAYYALCHSVGIAALVAAFIAARLLPGGPDARFAAVAASLALIVAPFSALAYLDSRPEAMPSASLILWFVSLAGESLMIASLPRFIHWFFESRHETAAFRVWTAAAVLAFASLPLGLAFSGRQVLFLSIPMVLMPGSIVYVVVNSLRHGVAARGPKEGSAEDRRWRCFLRRVTIATIAFLPALVVLDFFPKLGQAIGLRPQPFLKAFPLFYAVFSLAYLAATIPALTRSAAPAPRLRAEVRGRARDSAHMRRLRTVAEGSRGRLPPRLGAHVPGDRRSALHFPVHGKDPCREDLSQDRRKEQDRAFAQAWPINTTFFRHRLPPAGGCIPAGERRRVRLRQKVRRAWPRKATAGRTGLFPVPEPVRAVADPRLRRGERPAALPFRLRPQRFLGEGLALRGGLPRG